MSDLSPQLLLETPIVKVHDVRCTGECKHRSAVECMDHTCLVFPYRGIFIRHVGKEDVVADANQLLFFNKGQDYQVSHPVPGGDACLSISVAPELLAELASGEAHVAGGGLLFAQQRKRLDARAHVLVALLRHALANGLADALEGEVLALTLLRRSLKLGKDPARGDSFARQKLVDRVKLILAEDPVRRWTLNGIAEEAGGSPVYLTQVFQQVEQMPLYRYQAQLRLARALDLLGDYQDLTELALDLGFSSHSHFSAAFRRSFGRSPTEFKKSVTRIH